VSWVSERSSEFEALTVSHLAALYRFAARCVKDPQTAQDLVQESCLKAYRAFERFERGTDYRAWLFRILTNTVLDWRRRAVRRPVEVHLDQAGFEAVLSDPSLFTHAPGPDRNLAAGSLRAEVEAAVGALSEELQLVVHLSFVEGFSYKEIAEIAGCPVGTVMSRLYRARQVLRRELAHHLDIAAEPDAGGGIAGRTSRPLVSSPRGSHAQ
jgi:RNA polymerase sigma-70 factor, ECF subfamily